MKRKIKAGSTGYILDLFAHHTAPSDLTNPGIAIAWNTASLYARYKRAGQSSWTTITLVSATAGTWTSGGLAVASGGATGDFELHLPNAAVAAGARAVMVEMGGAANMRPIKVELELDAVDYQSAVWDVNLVTWRNYTPADLSPNGYVLVDVQSLLNDTYAASGLYSLSYQYADYSYLSVPPVTLADGVAESLADAIELKLADDGDSTPLLQLIAERVATQIGNENLEAAALAIMVRDAILDRMLAGNHDTDGTAGKALQMLDALVSSRLAGTDYTAPDNAGIADAAESAAAAATQAAEANARIGDGSQGSHVARKSDVQVSAPELPPAKNVSFEKTVVTIG